MIKRQEPLRYYPLAVTLDNKPVLVVGGGKVAERKVDSLRSAGAKIRLVSPTATLGLKDLARKNKIKWIQRYVQKSDIAKLHLVVAATDNRKINEKVSQWARQRKIWINVVDKTALSDFISPAVFRPEKSIVAVYTDGKDPVLSRDLKNFIKERWDDFLSYRHKL